MSLSARWDCMNTKRSRTLQTTEYSVSFLCVARLLSPPIQTHLVGVVTVTSCQFTPSQGFKPIVLNADSQKAGTVGGLHNASLSSPALGAIFM